MDKIWCISHLYILLPHVSLSKGGKIEEEHREKGADCDE